MQNTPRSVSWDAPEHYHIEKGGDWFFALTIITVAVVVVAIFLGNILFALLCGIAGTVLAIAAGRPPRIINYSVSVRGIKIGGESYPFTGLKAFDIVEDDPRGPQLLVLTQHHFMPLLVMPLPEEYIDDIEDLIAGRLPEEQLKEPFFNKVLEFFGF